MTVVVRTCPTCRGLGVLEVGNVLPIGPHLVKVDPGSVLEDIKAGLGLRVVAKRHRISVETARVIGNGTWAGFRRNT